MIGQTISDNRILEKLGAEVFYIRWAKLTLNQTPGKHELRNVQ